MRVRHAHLDDVRAIYDLVLYARRRVLLVEWSELRAALADPAHRSEPEASDRTAPEIHILCGQVGGRLGGFWASTVGAGQIAHLNALILHDKWAGSKAAAFLSGVRSSLRESGLAQIVYVGAERWLTTFLEENGFTLSGSVITLQKTDEAVPDRGNQQIDVRPAHTTYLAEVLALDERAFIPLWRTDAQTLTEQLSESPFFVVAEREKQTVGYAYASLVGKHGHLTRLVVDPGVQGQRIGARLLAECIDFFSSQGVYGITLNTQDDNTQALRLYRWFGFARLGHKAGVWLCPLT
jgi:ribosomal protein S18 acetylase RimI-like enzyme